MSSIVVKISNIGKAYRDYGSEWKRVLSWFGIKSKTIKETWTLHNIDFNLFSGQAIGIVGQNGAGKSTLLKIITGTLKQSTGTFNVYGRIAAILELGMGFHPDLTGRENAYHASGLMGFSKDEVDAVIEHIEDFSEIGDYFDKPVRMYSSGMQVRVAFAVATAYRPEILIVDEALSVGDTYFQHKSFERIREFQKHGTTLLLVSHDRNAIQAICDRVILLDQGQLIKDGEPEAVMDFYNAFIAEKEKQTISQEKLSDGKIKTISGTGEVKVQTISLYNLQEDEVEVVGVNEPLTLKIYIKVYDSIPALVLGYAIKDRLGQVVFGSNTCHMQQTIQNPIKGEEYCFSIKFDAKLGVGSYSIATALTSDETHLSANYEWRDLALIFSVINKDKNYFIGSTWLEHTISINKTKDSDA